MNKDFLLVHKSILPKDLDKVIEAKALVENNSYSISDACEKLKISRNKYYKYKDLVMLPTFDNSKKADLSLKVIDQKGILSNVLKILSSRNANIIKINQENPRQGIAYIQISIDTVDIKIPIDELINELEKEEGVMLVNLLALE